MNVREEVFEALGAASTCWQYPDKAGVFDSEKCKEVGDELMGKLDPYINELATKYIQPNLGLATTIELIREVNERANVAHLNGEEWPVYRTVQGE